MKKIKAPNLVTLAILTTITVLFWVFFSVFRVFANKPSVSVPPEVLEPITPTLDSETLGKIGQGVYLMEEDIPQNTVVLPTNSPEPTVLPTPTLSPSPTATSTASPEATPAESEQGT
jgi:hypothetical protein